MRKGTFIIEDWFGPYPGYRGVSMNGTDMCCSTYRFHSYSHPKYSVMTPREGVKIASESGRRSPWRKGASLGVRDSYADPHEGVKVTSKSRRRSPWRRGAKVGAEGVRIASKSRR